MRPDAPRDNMDRDNGLSNFDKEALNSPDVGKELELDFNRNEPDPALHAHDPVFIYDRTEPDIAFDRRDLDIVFNAQERDVSSRLAVKTGIALLIVGSIGAVAWWGYSLMEMRQDEGTSNAQIQNASQPTPPVPPEAPTNVVPPAPDPEPVRTDTAVEAATPSEPAAAIVPQTDIPATNALVAPGAEPAREEKRPANIEADAAGSLFAITRPLGAQVFLDNKLVGTTPLFMSRLSFGSHEVRLELPGFKTYSSSIQVEPKERARLAVQLEATP